MAHTQVLMSLACLLASGREYSTYPGGVPCSHTYIFGVFEDLTVAQTSPIRSIWGIPAHSFIHSIAWFRSLTRDLIHTRPRVLQSHTHHTTTTHRTPRHAAPPYTPHHGTITCKSSHYRAMTYSCKPSFYFQYIDYISNVLIVHPDCLTRIPKPYILHTNSAVFDVQCE